MYIWVIRENVIYFKLIINISEPSDRVIYFIFLANLAHSTILLGGRYVIEELKKEIGFLELIHFLLSHLHNWNTTFSIHEKINQRRIRSIERYIAIPCRIIPYLMFCLFTSCIWKLLTIQTESFDPNKNTGIYIYIYNY